MSSSSHACFGYGFAGDPIDFFENEAELREALDRAAEALDDKTTTIRFTSNFDMEGDGRVLVAAGLEYVEYSEVKRFDLDTLHALQGTARKRVLEAMAMLEAEHPLVAKYFKANGDEPSWLLWTFYG